MLDHRTHETHSHTHQQGCGHKALLHGEHVDYLHDGHLHHPHNDHVNEHALDIGQMSPDACTPDHTCAGHNASHTHGPNCGHEAVPHGDHVDYMVEGHLHHPHKGHCDHHGSVQLA